MDVIHKGPGDLKVTPNLTDYEQTRASFDWSAVPDVCAGMGGGGCNIAYAAVDRHAEGPEAGRTALRFIADDPDSAELTTHDVSYAELGRLTRKFTNVLRGLEIGKGDRVFVIMGRVPELYISMLGALRNGSVVSPLFSAFGPEPIAHPRHHRLGRRHRHDRRDLQAQDRQDSRPTRLGRARTGGRATTTPSSPGTLNFQRLMDEAARGRADRAHRPRRPVAVALHQRHHRNTQGRHARARRGRHALHHRPLCPRSARRRHLLVHSRSRLGHRHFLRHHLAAAARGHLDHRRGRVRRRAMVPRSCRTRRSASGTPRRPPSAC